MQTSFDTRASMSFNVMQPTFNMPSAFFGAGPALGSATHSVAPPLASYPGSTGGSSKSTSTQFMQQYSGSANGSFSSMSAFQKTSTSANRYQETSAFSSQWSNSDSFGSTQFFQQTSIGNNGRNQQMGNSGKTNNWSNTPVSDGKSSINLGNYTIDLNKKDSSMTLVNNQTQDKTKIWGDPHINQHDGTANQTSTMFKGPTSFVLPDNTKITVGTKGAGGSATYADNLTITNGNKAYSVNGLSEKNSAALTVQRSHDGRALDAAAPDGYTVVANRNGSGWIDPATHKAADFSKA
jgi:hypothetical protein